MTEKKVRKKPKEGSRREIDEGAVRTIPGRLSEDGDKTEIVSMRMTHSQRKYFLDAKKIIEGLGYKVSFTWVVLKMAEYGQLQFEREWLHPDRPKRKKGELLSLRNLKK